MCLLDVISQVRSSTRCDRSPACLFKARQGSRFSERKNGRGLSCFVISRGFVSWSLGKISGRENKAFCDSRLGSGKPLEQRLEAGVLKIDMMQASQHEGWEWRPFAGWPGFNLAYAPLEPVAPARSRSPHPRAAAAPPPAMAKAAPKAKAVAKTVPKAGAPKPP